MLSIKIKRKILSPNLRVAELKDFIGKYVEITVNEITPKEIKLTAKTAAGILSKYANTGKMHMEKEAWQMSVSERYGNS